MVDEGEDDGEDDWAVEGEDDGMVVAVIIIQVVEEDGMVAIRVIVIYLRLSCINNTTIQSIHIGSIHHIGLEMYVKTVVQRLEMILGGVNLQVGV